ncbi:MAG: threonylcarbamoyl-AMP synthase [bacterium]|uniref:Threonylcarbamoyl-AMP synthase n=1 Tax=Candidatus Aphodosoma intestinipullorum TaxID=2840674 RepID=A0A940DJC0_9BACT|nr:threonylcarbamoyl-AMP synthase [Candidatus Aphodosoma intestinipullorum]
MAVKLYPDNPDMKAIDNIVSLLRDGGIIIYPTDTVYAIGCDIRQARAVERICHFKKIDSKKARFTMLCDDISSASEYARIDNDTFKLLKANLPGPFTFILNGSSRLPKLLKNRNTIGIRIPDNNIIRTIVRELGNPMLTTSLKNLDMQSDYEPEYETDPELIEEKYGKIVDMVIDGGIGSTIASTVVDCTGDGIEIVRQGNVSLKY